MKKVDEATFSKLRYFNSQKIQLEEQADLDYIKEQLGMDYRSDYL